MRRLSRKWGSYYAQESTGELSLQVQGYSHTERYRRTWSDGKHHRLEDCIYAFVRGLLISADALAPRSLKPGG